MDCLPVRSMSVREITCTSDDVSESTRLMFEPVTSIFSIVCGAGFAGAGVCATAENTMPTVAVIANFFATFRDILFLIVFIQSS
jgi:hypothetical protein